MNPATRKLITQILRLSKGMISALEEWFLEVQKGS